MPSRPFSLSPSFSRIICYLARPRTHFLCKIGKQIQSSLGDGNVPARARDQVNNLWYIYIHSRELDRNKTKTRLLFSLYTHTSVVRKCDFIMWLEIFVFYMWIYFSSFSSFRDMRFFWNFRQKKLQSLFSFPFFSESPRFHLKLKGTVSFTLHLINLPVCPYTT